MAGFEVIVRPVIFPNIRPAPARSLAPEDDPEKGICVIHGASGGSVDLAYSWSVNMQKSKPTEQKREVDEVRIYQKDDDGEINRDNFIDVEVANKIWMEDSVGKSIFPKGFDADDVKEKSMQGPLTDKEIIKYTYAPVEEKDNIEIRERAVIKKNPDVQGSDE